MIQFFNCKFFFILLKPSIINKKKIADFEKGIWKSIKIVWMIICNTRNEIVLNETKQNGTKQNKQKRKEAYINETKQLYFVIFYKY